MFSVAILWFPLIVEMLHANALQELADMATQMQPITRSAPEQALASKTQELRQLFADAPEMAKTALENALTTLISEAAEASGTGERRPHRRTSGRGLRTDRDRPIRARRSPRLRAILRLLNGNFSGGKKVGTLHNMRFVFLDNDTKFLFATAYDGEWDPYIDDFATKIPDEMDIIFSAFEGWPGIRSPKVKDWIIAHQIPAEGWYVAHPDLTVAEAGRLKHPGKALEDFLDKLG